MSKLFIEEPKNLNSGKKKDSLLFLSPLPPPYSGVEFATEQFLNSPLKKYFEIHHLNTSISKNNAERGKIKISSILILLRISMQIIHLRFKHSVKKAYLPISSNRTSLYRDLFLVLLLFILRMEITGHYHGGNFHKFYHRCNKFEKKLIKFYLKRLKHFLLLGENIKNNITEHILDFNNIHIVSNGIRPFPRKIGRDYEKNINRFRLLFIGHLSFTKGFYDLILVYKRLLKKYNFISLNFAGQPIYSSHEKNILVKDIPNEFSGSFYKADMVIEEFIKTCSSYNAKYHGSVTGKIKENLFINSDIFVFPSYSEGLSMAVLEAMNYSLPVITTNVGALPEVVKDSFNGNIHFPGDQEKMFILIEKMIIDIPLRINYGSNSYQLIKSKFDIDIQAVDLTKIMLGKND